jgi:hypothetical protein
MRGDALNVLSVSFIAEPLFDSPISMEMRELTSILISYHLSGSGKY